MGMIDLKRIGGVEEGNEHGEKNSPARRRKNCDPQVTSPAEAGEARSVPAAGVLQISSSISLRRSG